MKTHLTAILLLACALPAAADTFTGTLDKDWIPAPTEQNPRNQVEVYLLKTADGVLQLEELEPYAPIKGLEDRGRITVEGKLVQGKLRIEKITAPAIERFTGTLYRTRKGLAGQILVDIPHKGEGIDVSGQPWLAFRKMTEDMSRHEIEFEAYPIYEQEKLTEVVVTRVKATAAERLQLVRNVFSFQGEVPEGETVWLVRRSLVGVSALVEAPGGKSGFALWDRLQIGRRLTPKKGVVDQIDPERRR